MNVSDEQSSHVVLMSEEYKPLIIADRIIAGILINCFIVGFVGNAMALNYFITAEKNKLLGNLYVIITATDLFTCVLQTPVAASFIMNRNPGIFKFVEFCAFWTIMFEFLQVSSIFLVMLLCVTRAVAIKFPLCTIDARAIVRIYYGYGFAIFLESGVRHLFDVYYMFVSDIGYCVKGSNKPAWSLYANVMNIISIGVPSAITFFSFVLSITELRSQNMRPSKVVANRASVTIAIFTAIFLVCNVPFFSNVILFVITRATTTYPGPVFSSTFMYSYSWIISKVLCVVINATLNPIIYFTRMLQIPNWRPKSAYYRSWYRLSAMKLRSIRKASRTEEVA